MRKPIKKFRCGPIVLSVWTDNKVVKEGMVTVYSLTIDKVYKSEDTWKYTKVFTIDDLPKIHTLADAVYKDLRVTVEYLTKPGEEYEESYLENEDRDQPHT